GAAVSPQEPRGELEGLSSVELMQEQNAGGQVADLAAGLDFGPALGELRHDLAGLVLQGACEDVVAPQPGEGGLTLDRGLPPDGERLVLVHDVSEKARLGLPEAEGVDRRGVPDPHRPLSRSSRTAFTPAPVGSPGRGIFQNPFGSFPEPSRTSPARASSRRWVGTSASPRPTGTILAIGFPRSVTMTSSPALTRARYSLRVAFSFATVVMAPDSPRVLQESRHPVTDIGIGRLIDLVLSDARRAAQAGELTVRDHGLARGPGGLERRLEVVFPRGRERGYADHRLVLTLAADSGLPVRAIVHDRDDGVVAEYAYRDLKLDAELTAADFDAANPAYGFPRWRWQLK